MLKRVSVAVLGAALAGVFGLAVPASAHVSIEPKDAVQGGYARVVFRVPNERDDASTTKVEIHLPEDNPVAGVRTMPVPGWKVEITERKLEQPIDRHGQQIGTVVGVLAWTPTSKAHAIAPDSFMEFPVSLGPLPEADTLVFKALQTYSNGEVVRWIEEPTEGEEPEHPAPVLRLAKAPTDATMTPVGPEGTTQAAPAGAGGGGTPLWLSIAGLVAGLAGLALGGLAFARSGR